MKVELGGKGQSENGHKNEIHDPIQLQNSPPYYPATEQDSSNRRKHFFERFSRIPRDTFCPRNLERAYCTSGPQNASDARDRNGLKRQKKLGRNFGNFQKSIVLLPSSRGLKREAGRRKVGNSAVFRWRNSAQNVILGHFWAETTLKTNFRRRSPPKVSRRIRLATQIGGQIRDTPQGGGIKGGGKPPLLNRVWTRYQRSADSSRCRVARRPC